MPPLKYADFAFQSSPAVLADPALPHQVVLRFDGRFIIVSCNCLRYREVANAQFRFRPLIRKTQMGENEPITAWREHMKAIITEAIEEDGDQ
jgi:hypothetical protein